MIPAPSLGKFSSVRYSAETLVKSDADVLSTAAPETYADDETNSPVGSPLTEEKTLSDVHSVNALSEMATTV